MVQNEPLLDQKMMFHVVRNSASTELAIATWFRSFSLPSGNFQNANLIQRWGAMTYGRKAKRLYAAKPPSTRNEAPVMLRPPSPARWLTIAAMSSGVP
jgi:hypothetical protein